MANGFQGNKKFGGLHKYNMNSDSLGRLEEALKEAKKNHKTRFYFQKVEITTLIAQYILRYYGEEGKRKRNLFNY